MPIKITKADGTVEFFKLEKLRRSLRRSGARPEEVNRVIAQITPTLRDGITTQEIYRNAFKLLHDSDSPVAARYSLRRALFNLGPTGFPFEKFLARLFASDGYVTKTGTVIAGKCAEHEIDLAAYKSDHSFVAEAKFHARPGVKSDLQVALYSYARLIDLRENKICFDDICGIKEFWLITNTKFTSTASAYGQCVGLKMLSWDYPKHNNLHDRIQRAGIYPITVLEGLSAKQARILIERDIILCKDLVEQPHVLNQLHLNSRKHEHVLQEARALSNQKK